MYASALPLMLPRRLSKCFLADCESLATEVTPTMSRLATSCPYFVLYPVWSAWSMLMYCCRSSFGIACECAAMFFMQSAS